MKKNYFMVLIALLVFALNANAQDATGQDETNNRMTVKMNDGTSFILNTDNVAEITFGDGEPAFSAQNIAKALEALDELGQYVNRLDALERNDEMLITFAEDLKAIEYDTRMRTEQNQGVIEVLKRNTDELKTMIYALEVRSATQDCKIDALETHNAALATELASQEDLSNNLLVRISALESSISILHAQMANLAEQMADLKAQVNSMLQ